MTDFHAVFEDIVEVDTECPRCHRGSTARVKSRGTGSAASFFGLDRGYAQEQALEVAKKDTVHQAKLTMSLVRCAHCHHRSRRELARFIGLNALGTLAFLAFLAIGFLANAPWYMLAVFGLMAAGVPFNAYRRFNLAASLVLSVRPRAILPVARALAVPAPAVKPVSSRAPDPEPERSESPRILR